MVWYMAELGNVDDLASLGRFHLGIFNFRTITGIEWIRLILFVISCWYGTPDFSTGISHHYFRIFVMFVRLTMLFLFSLVYQPRNEVNFSVFFADYTDFSLL